jgi:hypothetical protein
VLLKRHQDRHEKRPNQHWVDFAQHLAECWESFEAGLHLYDPRMNTDDSLYSPRRSPDGGPEIRDLLSRWREVDPLATRFTMPADTTADSGDGAHSPVEQRSQVTGLEETTSEPPDIIQS